MKQESGCCKIDFSHHQGFYYSSFVFRNPNLRLGKHSMFKNFITTPGHKVILTQARDTLGTVTLPASSVCLFTVTPHPPPGCITTCYFFISLVLGPLNSLVWYVPSLRYTRGLGWRVHCGVEVTESSTNKQHHLFVQQDRKTY
jgi:hypothetical protein